MIRTFTPTCSLTEIGIRQYPSVSLYPTACTDGYTLVSVSSKVGWIT